MYRAYILSRFVQHTGQTDAITEAQKYQQQQPTVAAACMGGWSTRLRNQAVATGGVGLSVRSYVYT